MNAPGPIADLPIIKTGVFQGVVPGTYVQVVQGQSMFSAHLYRAVRRKGPNGGYAHVGDVAIAHAIGNDLTVALLPRDGAALMLGLGSSSMYLSGRLEGMALVRHFGVEVSDLGAAT